jgi:hypothetical protein
MDVRHGKICLEKVEETILCAGPGKTNYIAIHVLIL